MPFVPGRPVHMGPVKRGQEWKPPTVEPPKDHEEYSSRVRWAQHSIDPAATARRLKVRLPSRSQGGIHIGGR